MMTPTAALLLTMLQAQNTAPPPEPVGRPEVGKAHMESNDQRCMRCHGVRGEGAFGPDLAGRGLSFAQFKRAVREPWGIMPAMTEEQISDQTLADVAGYFASLPKVAQPGPWRTTVPPGASHVQELVIATAACGQCHGIDLVGSPRHVGGGEGADYAWFVKRVYEHSDVYPQGHMGNFSMTRLPEPLLKEIWQYVSDLGFLANVRAAVDPPVSAGGTVTYTLNVENRGLPGKGLVAEDVTISLVLSPGAKVVSTTGDGYKGVRHDAKSGMDEAVWQVRRVAAGETQKYTVTLSGTGAAAGISKGSTVSWTKPPLREANPNIVSRDDKVDVVLPRTQQTQ